MEERRGDPNHERSGWRGERGNLAHKEKQLERPIQSVCPLETTSAEHEPEQGVCPKRREPTRERRQAAVDTASRIKNIFGDNDQS